MGRRTEEVTVGGREFRLTMLPATRGQELFARLCRHVVPPAAKAFAGSGFKSIASLMEGDLRGLGAGLADGVAQLLGNLNEAEQRLILKELLSDAYMRGEDEKFVKLADVYEDAFAGRVEDIYELALESLKLNYSGFYAKLSAAISSGITKAEAEQKPAAAA